MALATVSSTSQRLQIYRWHWWTAKFCRWNDAIWPENLFVVNSKDPTAWPSTSSSLTDPALTRISTATNPWDVSLRPQGKWKYTWAVEHWSAEKRLVPTNFPKLVSNRVWMLDKITSHGEVLQGKLIPLPWGDSSIVLVHKRRICNGWNNPTVITLIPISTRALTSMLLGHPTSVRKRNIREWHSGFH